MLVTYLKVSSILTRLKFLPFYQADGKDGVLGEIVTLGESRKLAGFFGWHSRHQRGIRSLAITNKLSNNDDQSKHDELHWTPKSSKPPTKDHSNISNAPIQLTNNNLGTGPNGGIEEELTNGVWIWSPQMANCLWRVVALSKAISEWKPRRNSSYQLAKRLNTNSSTDNQ